MVDSVLVIIPARLKSRRLAEKPLADIGGRAMIVRVLERATAAGIGPVLVATDSAKIAAAVSAAGGTAMLTREDHASGSDRVHEAAELIDPKHHASIVLNVQGDMPTIAPETIRAVLEPLEDPQVDIATAAAEIRDAAARSNPHVVKAVGSPIGARRLRALYFTRATAPWGNGPLYQHFGLYAFRRAALARFVALPPSTLERREQLEQLRAMEAAMRIDIALVDAAPPEVNTPEDLEPVRAGLRD
jgi:3-deoxy-manno-octulosonate cytidylyltransferase (CMP-KDO synthetase)